MYTVLTNDGSRTLFSPEYGETYHSIHGALAEARHVFLSGAQVTQQLATTPALRVLEVGFGAGLNFTLTSAAAHAAGARLEYTGLETALPAADLIAALGYREGSNHSEAAGLIRWRQTWPSAVPEGRYELLLGPGCRLTLLIGDATQQALPPLRYHAVFLDAFSPRVNPELWTPSYMQVLYDATAPGGILATYSAAGHVRRALSGAGYSVKRRPGPPGKREVLAAVKPDL